MEHIDHYMKFFTIVSCILLIVFNPAQAECTRQDSDDLASECISPSGSPENYASAPSPSTQSAYSPSCNDDLPGYRQDEDDDEESDNHSILHPLNDIVNNARSSINDLKQSISWLGSSPAPEGSRAAKTNNPELKKICDNTDFPHLCISSISPYFNGNTETAAILELAIKAATQHTKQAIDDAAKFAVAAHTNDDTSSGLRDCKDDYNDALENLQAALDAIPGRDIGTVETMLSAAVSDYSTCHDDFPGKNPIASYGETLVNMASNCLALSSMIQ